MGVRVLATGVIVSCFLAVDYVNNNFNRKLSSGWTLNIASQKPALARLL